MGHIDFGSKCVLFMNPNFNSTINDNRLRFLPNFTIPNSVNKYSTANPANGAPKMQVGKRVIIGNTPPDLTVKAYKNDVYRTTDVKLGHPYEWVATNTNINHGSEVKWRPIAWVSDSFTTAALPVLRYLDVGVQNINSTLGKVVTWNGSAWI